MIVSAAIQFNGKTYSLPAPNRHHNILYLIYNQIGIPIGDNLQGFLDDKGNFLNRFQALEHALSCNQVKNVDDIRAGRLFSEDLW